MKGWMEYVYMQQQYPTSITGVPISINVLNSNGNYRTIGITTSNANGMFSYTWKPDIAGDFIVTASFVGSESYLPSHADTSFNAAEAPTTQPSSGQQSNGASTSDLLIPIAAGFIAVIIAIAIVGALILRRRP